MLNKLSMHRYSVYLGLQLLFLLVDLFVNSYSYVLRGDRVGVMVLLYVLQDVCLVLSLCTLFFGLYSTCVYQAGLIRLLSDKFRTPVVTLVAYLLLSVTHHVWIVLDYQSRPLRYQWSTGLTALWFVQRLVSPFYYYLFKRSALRLSDPRYHENMEWINERLAIK